MAYHNILTPILACSGPGAAAAIDNNFRLSMLWTIPALLFGLGIWKFHSRLGGKISLSLLILYLLLLLFHPAWSISAMVGDCGQAKLAESKNFVLYMGSIFLFQLLLFWHRNFGFKQT
jgi:hypothetical protein